NFIWFSSVLKAQGLGSNPVTVRFDAQTIQFSAAGNPFVLNVPNASITFSPTATLATTTFNTVANEWETVVPSSGLSGNDFVSGLAFEVPFDFPGGINPVIWSGTFSSDTPGVSINWQWAAAVYTMFSTDYNLLGVKPVDHHDARRVSRLRTKRGLHARSGRRVRRPWTRERGCDLRQSRHEGHGQRRGRPARHR